MVNLRIEEYLPLSLAMFPFVSNAVCGVCTLILYEVDCGEYRATNSWIPRWILLTSFFNNPARQYSESQRHTSRFIYSDNGNPNTSTPRSKLNSFPDRLIRIILPAHFLHIQYHSNMSRQLSQRTDIPLNHIPSPITPCMPIIPKTPNRINQPIPPCHDRDIHHHHTLQDPQKQIIKLSTEA